MNRNEFFSVAKLTNSPVIVRQHGDKGYALSLVKPDENQNFDGDENIEITMMYKSEPRFFKSLSGIESTLKDQGIFSFTVKMSSDEITKATRERKTDAEKQAELIAKAENAVKIAEQKAKEAKEKAAKLKGHK